MRSAWPRCVSSTSAEDWKWREPTDWTERYLGRIADLRSALSWSFGQQGDAILGIRIAVAAITLWSRNPSILSEAQARLEVALTLAKRVPCDELSKAKLACALGWSLFYARKSSNENEVTWLDAIAFARRADSVDLQQRALVGFAFYLLQIGEIARAIVYLEEATSLADRDPRFDSDIRSRQGSGLGPSLCRRIKQKPPGSRSSRVNPFAGPGAFAQGCE